MSLEELGMEHKKIQEQRIASIRFPLRERKDLTPKLDRLIQECGEYICGPPLVVYHWGTGVPEECFDVEVGFPVTRAVETGEIQSRILESAEALTAIHHGRHEELGKVYSKIYAYAAEHGMPGSLTQREVYLVSDPDNPERNVTELQVILHEWHHLLAENLERVLGDESKEKVMAGVDEITPESNPTERANWVKAAMERLDALTDDEQRFEILSRCAHVFPQERIDYLRAIYEQNKDIEEVLEAMSEAPGWYANPIREGRVLHVKKNPVNPEKYEKATTEAEKRMHYCHCPLVRKHLDGLSPTFCYCGTGWYRRLWEGILGKPVRVEIVKSLLKGDDCCRVAIHLPLAE